MSIYQSESQWQRLLTIAYIIKRLEGKDKANRGLILDQKYPYISVQERDKILAILG